MGKWKKCSAHGKPKKALSGKPTVCGCNLSWCLGVRFVANYTGTYPDGISRPCVLSSGTPGWASTPPIVTGGGGGYRTRNPQIVTVTLPYLRDLVFNWTSPADLGMGSWEVVHTEAGPDGTFTVWGLGAASQGAGLDTDDPCGINDLPDDQVYGPVLTFSPGCNDIVPGAGDYDPGIML